MIEGNPRIEEVRNQVALKRGPIVYAIESPDLPKDATILDVYLPGDQAFKAVSRPDFLGGLTVIEADVSIRTDKKDGMYRKVTKPEFTTFPTQFVPYYAWSNRGTSEMTVFVPVVWGKR